MPVESKAVIKKMFEDTPTTTHRRAKPQHTCSSSQLFGILGVLVAVAWLGHGDLREGQGFNKDPDDFEMMFEMTKTTMTARVMTGSLGRGKGA